MIVLLGNTGYIGQAFERVLREGHWPYIALSRRQLDYTQFDLFRGFLREVQPTFVINAAGYTGKPNVDACEENRADTLHGNALFPATLAQACSASDIPFGHVSSGCIYSGAKVAIDGETRIERDLTQPWLQTLLLENPRAFHGFTENDAPNFSFRSPPCSFYSGSKAMGEEAIGATGQGYIWRLRIPFDEIDNARNYLTKIQSYPKVYQNVNSISHRGDFVRACLELWEKRAPFGIYNITNPGFVTTRQVIALVEKYLAPTRTFQFWKDDEEFYRLAARTQRSNCILDCSKLLTAGVKMRPVDDAIVDSLKKWTPSHG